MDWKIPNPSQSNQCPCLPLPDPSCIFLLTLTHEPLGESRGRLVDGALAVLVLDGDEGAALEEVLGAVLELPEAGVVHRRVAVLVDEVDVRLVLQQLRKEGMNDACFVNGN